MPQASLQLNQLLGDGALLNALKKGGLKKDGLLGSNAATQGQAFQSLLAGIAKARSGDQVSTILTASATASTASKGSTTPDTSSLWAQLQLTPELIANLKNMTAEDFKNLSPEMAMAIAPHLNAAGQLNDRTLSILDALSTTVDDGSAPELFTMIDDPELAAFLAGIAARISAQNGGQMPSFGADSASAVQTNAPSNASFMNALMNANATLNPDGRSITAEVEVLPGETITITIADLDMEGFQAFKKLAFADIAPYLSAPRMVHTSGNGVMKIAQGPSFLSDDGTETSLLSSIAGLVPSLPQETLTALQNAQTTTETPIFLDTTKTTATIAAKDPIPREFGRAHLFAALMGIPMNEQQKTGESAQKATDAVVTAQPGEGKTASALLLQTQAVPKAAAVTTPAPVVATPGMTSVTTGEALKGLDLSVGEFDLSMPDGFENALHVRADTTTPTSSITTLIAAKAAGQPHPASHLVSVAVQRAAENAAAGESRIFVIQMDPPNLGRVKVTLEFGENNTVKAKLLAERPETVSLLQKDAAMLERALQNSGVDTDKSSLTFDLAQDNAFSGGHDGHGGHGNGGFHGDDENGTDLATIETVMPIFVDPETGLTHVNIVV